MKVVQIISGGYGFRAKAGAPTKLILAGEVVCVDDAEAERLVKLGVAAEAELDAETKAIVEQADADSNDVETQEEASEAEEKPGRKRPQDCSRVSRYYHDRLFGNGNG